MRLAGELLATADEAFSLVASCVLGSLVLDNVLVSLKSPQYFSSSGFSLSSSNHILLLRHACPDPVTEMNISNVTAKRVSKQPTKQKEM